MRCFYASETQQHNPQFRLTHGSLMKNAEQPRRAELLLAGLDELGWSPQSPPAAAHSDYATVHTTEFLTFLETAWEAWQALPDAGPEVVPNAFAPSQTTTYPDGIVGRAGWHMGDTSAPIGPNSWLATCRAADSALAASDAVLQGASAAYALTRPPGHHSTADKAAGHCLMNVAALAAARLRRQHNRVATLDIDVHHGNGTQTIFYERDDVLTVSVHADPSDYYPFFLGYSHETGVGLGQGLNLNLPLPRSTSDDGWIAAIDVGLARIAAFRPGALVVSLGLDAHENDPLDGMKVTWDGFARAGGRISQANYPTVFIQEGGYLSDDLTRSLVSFFQGYTGSD